MRRLSMALVLVVMGLFSYVGAPPADAADNLTNCTNPLGYPSVTNGASCGFTAMSTPFVHTFVVPSTWGPVTDTSNQNALSFDLAADSVGYVSFSTSLIPSNCNQQYGLGIDSTIAPTVAAEIITHGTLAHITLTALVSLAAGSHTIYLLGEAPSPSCPSGDLAAALAGSSGLSFSVTVVSNTASTTSVSTIRFIAKRTGSHVAFHWRVKAEPGIAGFNIIAGHNTLTRHPVGVHASGTYTVTRTWPGTGPYFLQVLRSDGGAILIPAI